MRALTTTLVCLALVAMSLVPVPPAVLAREVMPAGNLLVAASAAAAQPLRDASVVFIENVGQFVEGARFQVRRAGPTF